MRKIADKLKKLVQRAIGYYRKNGLLKLLRRIAKESARVKKILYMPVEFAKNTVRLLINPKKKISIVIPVYNDEQYVKDCLDSIIAQKNPLFEIICVEDGSDDRSFEILQEYAQKDDRIRIIRKDKNEGTHLARIAGALAAKGSYITFVDADDVVSPDFCSFIQRAVRISNADIIHFNIGVQNCSGDEDVRWVEEMLGAQNREIKGPEILREAYVKRSFTTSMLAKLFKRELLQQAIRHSPFVNSSVGEDIFFFFYVAYHAKTYKGIRERKHYIYRYGLGVSDRRAMSLEKFEKFCAMAKLAKIIQDEFCSDRYDASVCECAKAMAVRMAEDGCRILKNRIAEEETEAGHALIRSYWGEDPVFQNVYRQWFQS